MKNISCYRTAISLNLNQQPHILLSKISAKALELFYNSNIDGAINMCQIALGHYLEEQPDHIYESVLAPIYATLSILNVYSGNKEDAYTYLLKAQVCNRTAHITLTANIIYSISEDIMLPAARFNKVASTQFRDSPYCLFYYFAVDKFLTKSGKIDERYQDLHNLFSAQALYNIVYMNDSLRQYRKMALNSLEKFSYAKLAQKVRGLSDSEQPVKFNEEITSKLQSLLKDPQYISSYCFNVFDNGTTKKLISKSESEAPTSTSDPIMIINSTTAPISTSKVDENANLNESNSEDYDAQTLQTNPMLRNTLIRNFELSTKHIKLLFSQEECDVSILYELGLKDNIFDRMLKDWGANLSRITCNPKFFQTHFNSLSEHKPLKAIGIKNIETGKTTYYDTPAIFINSSLSNKYNVDRFNKFLGYTAIYSQTKVDSNTMLEAMQSFITNNTITTNIVSYRNAIIICNEKQLTRLLNKISAKALELFYNSNIDGAINMCKIALGHYLEEQAEHIYNTVLAPIYATLSILNLYSGNKVEAENNFAKAGVCNSTAHITVVTEIIHSAYNNARASAKCIAKVASPQFRDSPYCLFYYFAVDKFLTKSGKIDERSQDLRNLFSAQALYSIGNSDPSVNQYQKRLVNFVNNLSYTKFRTKVSRLPDSEQPVKFDQEIRFVLQSLLQDPQYISNYCHNVINNNKLKPLTSSKASAGPSTT